MKKCTSCEEVMDLGEFYIHPKMKDGHLNKCKKCCKLYALERRLNTEETRIADRLRYYKSEERREYSRRNTEKWRIKNPEKRKAQTKLNNAIRDKKITKKACEVCGNDRSHGHHHDYLKPLDVIWLCAKCHARHHRDERNAEFKP